jgi:plastocyanin
MTNCYDERKRLIKLWIIITASIVIVFIAGSPLIVTHNQASAQAPSQTPVQTTGPAGKPLTILVGASVQGNPSYDPATLTVKKGEKITVTNQDISLHTVTSGTGPTDPNNGKQFDTGMIKSASTANIETSNINPGEYAFHCTVHPFMIGKLVVQ